MGSRPVLSLEPDIYPWQGGGMKILLTAFEPFGGDTVNASLDVARAVRDLWAGPGELVTATLSVSFERAPRELLTAIEEQRPDAVVCLGEAGGRDVVTPERWAGAVADARIPDNDGSQPRMLALDDGPDRIGSRLDTDALVVALARAGTPARASDDAGRFVCNAVYRAVLRHFEGPATFIHVPAIRPDHTTALVGAETDEGGSTRRATISTSVVAAGIAAALAGLQIAPG